MTGMAPTKRKMIVDVLRERIRSGEYRAGARIPSQRQLLQEFKASPVTLQRAIDRLSEQGFLEARGTTGTFLVEHLPDRSCCALVFAQGPESPGWNRFYSTLQREAEDWHDDDGWRFDTCFVHAGSEAQRNLDERILDGALAGLLFTSLPFPHDHSPLLTASIPRVAIGTGACDYEASRLGATLIHLQDDDLLKRICSALAMDGRLRLAALTALQPFSTAETGIAIARKAGLDSRIEWWLGLSNSPTAAPAARAIVHLLCTGRPEDRPDCLVVTDDNLLPGAVAGILDAGLRVPEDIAVIAHANFPTPAGAGIPCRRYGYDSRLILRMAQDEIARLRSGFPRRLVEAPVSFADG